MEEKGYDLAQSVSLPKKLRDRPGAGPGTAAGAGAAAAGSRTAGIAASGRR